jgi:Stealth protein CR2, conserved region 2/Stealth protein CR1, conserved region 1/Stealth protein CR3, conserved region 3/Stealth protein CR4, conserved region 4
MSTGDSTLNQPTARRRFALLALAPVLVAGRKLVRTQLALRARRFVSRLSARRPEQNRDPAVILHDGVWMYPLDGRLPRTASAENAELVLALLDDLGIPYTEVRNSAHVRMTVALSTEHRARLLSALSGLGTHYAIYSTVLVDDAISGAVPRLSDVFRVPPNPALPVSNLARHPDTVAVARVWRFYRDPESGFVLGGAYGCEIEFWTKRVTAGSTEWSAPRPNVAGITFSGTDMDLRPRKAREQIRTNSVFDRQMIDDIVFPIDVVYTWVDDADPAWREKLERFSGYAPADHHHQARAKQRFRSRDELRYSLRSLDMYAPWVRNVYIVTDDQDPGFIDFDNQRIRLVDHHEIAPDPAALPVFNSNAIISWLHRIPGLSEHYIYINDDVFFGKDTNPAVFFTPSGLAMVFPSNNRRPFGEPSPDDEPHVNISRNIRALLERDFGRTISRSVKHTPHAQLVSVQEEMEKRYPDVYARTSRSRFRHHDDIAADQLFHYYAQITGRAVVGRIRYAYVNIGDRAATPELARLLATRTRDVFCLNDAPVAGLPAIDDATVRSFLQAYFPVPSTFERRPA